MNHTPGIARVTKATDDKHGGYYLRVVSPDGTDTPIAITRHGEQQANAARLALAWNCHEELVEALKASEAYITELCKRTGDSSDTWAATTIAGNAQKLARAALAKVGGGK